MTVIGGGKSVEGKHPAQLPYSNLLVFEIVEIYCVR
jgi:hypothetical protein